MTTPDEPAPVTREALVREILAAFAEGEGHGTTMALADVQAKIRHVAREHGVSPEPLTAGDEAEIRRLRFESHVGRVLIAVARTAYVKRKRIGGTREQSVEAAGEAVIRYVHEHAPWCAEGYDPDDDPLVPTVSGETTEQQPAPGGIDVSRGV